MTSPAKDPKVAPQKEQTAEDGKVHSSTKPLENAPKVVLDHGEPENKDEAEAPTDPWGSTPVQQRDDHDEAVDPTKVGVGRGGADGLDPSPRAGVSDAMEPGGENSPVEGGTNAPA